jgi:hypothetical protein
VSSRKRHVAVQEPEPKPTQYERELEKVRRAVAAARRRKDEEFSGGPPPSSRL